MTDDEKKYQINLRQLIEDYVWGQFLGNMSFLHRLFTRRRHYEFDIRWGYMDFNHTTTTKKRESTIYITVFTFLQLYIFSEHIVTNFVNTVFLLVFINN